MTRIEIYKYRHICEVKMVVKNKYRRISTYDLSGHGVRPVTQGRMLQTFLTVLQGVESLTEDPVRPTEARFFCRAD